MVEYKRICINSLKSSKKRCDNYKCHMFIQEDDRDNAMKEGKFITYVENESAFSKCNKFIEYVISDEGYIL